MYRGPRTTDEMCVLVGSYCPADPRTATCLDETGARPGGDWIGQGSATCAQTFTCLQSATSFEGMIDCMVVASPSVSHPTSELLRCLFDAEDPVTQCRVQIETCVSQ